MDLFAYGKEEEEREEQKTRPIFPTKETRKTIGEKMTRKIRGLTALEAFFSQIWTLLFDCLLLQKKRRKCGGSQGQQR